MREIAREASVQWLGSEEPLIDAEDEIGAGEAYAAGGFEFIY
jgi:hypothetical protein